MKFIVLAGFLLAIVSNTANAGIKSSPLPTGIDPRAIAAAKTFGWAVDANKSLAKVRVLRYNKATGQLSITLSTRVAFAGVKDGKRYHTYDGVFHIYAEFGRYFTSKEYHNAPMAYAACFNKGECFHQDGLFPSHGCVHIPLMADAKYIDHLPLGTPVVVHVY